MATKLCSELLSVIFEEVLMAELDDPATGAGASTLGPALSATSPSAVVTTFSSSPSSALCTGSSPGSLAGSLVSSFTSSLTSGSTETDSPEPQRNGKRSASAHGTVCSATRVCKKWNVAATKALYSDPGPAISRYEGLYLPRLIVSLKKDEFLRESVRSLTITASLEAGLWVSSYKREGDLFCELVELCPRLRSVTLPSFEKACRSRVVAALQACQMMESFNIRVYLESSRRDPRFKKVIPYDSWKLELVSSILPCWPRLKDFTVRHIPDNSYHLIPDIVLEPPTSAAKLHLPYTLPAHTAALTTLSLRETFIDDQGLSHLMQGSRLTTLCLMSCQGITSSAITRAGLLAALAQAGPTLEHLTIMTPWLPHSAVRGESDLVLDGGVKHCPRLRTLCVAGYDVTGAVLRNLPNPQILERLEIMDFELISPQIIFDISGVKRDKQRTIETGVERRRFESLKELAVWQRNAGVGRARVSNGWFRACFERPNSPAAVALHQAGIKLGTGWESRLISGSPIDYHEPQFTASAFRELDRLSPV